MNETNGMRVITLKDLWELFLQRIVVIALAAVIAAGSFFAVDMLTYDPLYSSTATLYILRQTDSEYISSGEAANELNLALRLLYDCNYFLKSRTVLDTVIEDLNLDMTYGELLSRVKTSNPTNTRIMEITVDAETPEQAKAIVDRICEIGPKKVEQAMGMGQVNMYEYGTLPTTPSNSPSILKYAVAGIAAAVVIYAVFLLMYILDDRIRTDEDIERYLNLSILAEIPNVNSSSGSGYGYYKGSGNGKKTRGRSVTGKQKTAEKRSQA